MTENKQHMRSSNPGEFTLQPMDHSHHGSHMTDAVAEGEPFSRETNGLAVATAPKTFVLRVGDTFTLTARPEFREEIDQWHLDEMTGSRSRS